MTRDATAARTTSDLRYTRGLFEVVYLVGDLDAHLRGPLRQEGATGWDQAHSAKRPLHAATTAVGAQLTDPREPCLASCAL